MNRHSVRRLVLVGTALLFTWKIAAAQTAPVVTGDARVDQLLSSDDAE